MEFRRLGTTGLHVSAISYGNWLTHGEQVDRDTAAACVRAALDQGITTFDTADVYARGAAEEVLGEALRGVPRHQVEIFTKVCLPVGDGANDRGLSRKHVRESIDASLRRLRTDYVDLYQAHRYDETTPLEETLIAFDDLVRQGKVCYLLRPLADEADLSMAQLAVAWTLQHDFVATAIIGASRPEQVAENVGAAGVRLAPDLLARIDDVLGDLVERDPAKTADPMNVKPSWRRGA